MRRNPLVLFLSILGLPALLAPPAAEAQSCILTRLDTPVLNAFPDVAASEQTWQISLAWRYGKSDRHFVGTEEQKQRQAEGSEVINEVHFADVAIRRSFGPRNSLELGIPYLMATRSSPIRGANREVIGRSIGNSRGLGDITIVGQHLLWDPQEHPKSNVALSLGLKLPTGQNNVTDTRLRWVDGEIVSSVETIDQSVQPGDGGFGLILGVSGFQVFGESGSWAAYGSATYIVEPEGTNGVYTYRSAPGEEINSISDQYVARAGLQLSGRGWHGWAFGLGGRIEGIPVHDLVGSSDGFRRPGYMISVEPSASWSRGPHSVQMAVPVAVVRNRQRSVPDLENGRHGDAAFPDIIFLASYSYRF